MAEQFGQKVNFFPIAENFWLLVLCWKILSAIFRLRWKKNNTLSPILNPKIDNPNIN